MEWELASGTHTVREHLLRSLHMVSSVEAPAEQRTGEARPYLVLGIPPHPDVENESKCSRERFLRAGALLVDASRPFEALPRSQVGPTTAAPRRPPCQPISSPKRQQQQQTVNTSVVVIRNLDMR